MPIELAIIVPTLNEAGNVEPLIARLDAVLRGIEWELIFVDDDSTDGTADLVREISQTRPRVRVLQRIGRTSLSSACIEGMLATSAPFLAVMDADLQHDESILPAMLQALRSEPLDIVVGSRHVEGGSMGSMAPHRQFLSRCGARFSSAVCRCQLSDPMSGYFMLTRRFFESAVRRLSGIGFKILVDILASSSRPARVKEIPYEFRSRLQGQSKLEVNTGIEYMLLLADKLLGDIAPARFVAFVLAGAIGTLLSLLLMMVFYRECGLSFAQAQLLATYLALVPKYLINNFITYHDIRLRGWRLMRGFISYCLACTLGAVANLGVAEFLVGRGVPWYLAAGFGLMIGSVWNYGVTYVFTWHIRRRRTNAQVARASGNAVPRQEPAPLARAAQQ
jgi:dolichol-phosphate mannosyltransferase